jgi:hypothetical protein
VRDDLLGLLLALSGFSMMRQIAIVAPCVAFPASGNGPVAAE